MGGVSVGLTLALLSFHHPKSLESHIQILFVLLCCFVFAKYAQSSLHSKVHVKNLAVVLIYMIVMSALKNVCLLILIHSFCPFIVCPLKGHAAINLICIFRGSLLQAKQKVDS